MDKAALRLDAALADLAALLRHRPGTRLRITVDPSRMFPVHAEVEGCGVYAAASDVASCLRDWRVKVEASGADRLRR